MKHPIHISAAALTLLVAGNSLAVWGVKYEVNSGSGWTNATTIDVSAAPQTIDFRISVFHDGAEQLLSDAWTHPIAIAPFRLCNSQIVKQFGDPLTGDVLVEYKPIVSSYNNKALAHSQSGPNLILGTPNSVLSFATNSQVYSNYGYLLEAQYFAGTLLIGNSTAGAQSRTITVTANTFAYPNAGSGTGGQFGASFLYQLTPTILNAAIVTKPAQVLPATITVQLPCPADLNGDRLVDDADFAVFSAALDVLDCSDPSMPSGCAADVNKDGVVDDSDFVIFALAYQSFLCQ